VIRVLVVDDQELMRAGLRVLLDAHDDILVVGEAGDGAAAVEAARALRPDVVLMDISMPGMDGVEATRRLAAERDLATAKVLILTSFETDEHLFAALRWGASGFLAKDAEPATITDAVRVVAAGDALLTPAATRRLIAELAGWPERRVGVPPLLEELTAREREVLALVAYGLTNRQIADRLVISPATAKTHVSRAMTKLHAHDRAQLVVFAYQSGLVSSGRAAREAA
jgi:DNA-binding NarL/FixJ family response regulator